MKSAENMHLELRKFVAPEYIFGADARLLAASYCKKLGGNKVFIVSDSGIENNTEFLSEVYSGLEEVGTEYVLFKNVSPNPRDYEVAEGAAVYLESGCNLILAVGGGSVMDAAKAIGVVANNGKPVAEFEGVDKIEVPMPPLVCIPTTAGTAADVSQFAIINNTDEKYKMALISKALVPDVALIDPVTLLTMDDYLTACTGMDALCHAFEAFASNANSHFTDLFALEAIKHLHAFLRGAIEIPDDVFRRSETMLGSLYAGLAFSNASLGCVHSMAHSLGGYLDLPHGECNAILLPHVVDFNFFDAEERYKKIAKTVGLPTKSMTGKEVKNLLKEYLLNLKEKVGIINNLGEKGVSGDIIPALAEKAINDPCNATNPREPQKRDLEVIYGEAL
jgi:alcohol dehydrogenase class IV